jgi:hypothetical protein
MKHISGNRILQVLVHIIAWGLFLSLLTSLVPRPPNMNPLLSIIVPDLFFVSFYYINFYYLVPQFFISKKFVLFGIICAAYLALTIAVPSSISGSAYGKPEFREPPDRMEFRHEPPPVPHMERPGIPGNKEPGRHFGGPLLRIRLFIPEYSYTIFVFLFILTLSTGIRILLECQQAEREKVKAELAFLKAQINPHFLFNTLNSIYSMAVIKDRKTPDAIELFSDLMRYVLYEASHDFIPLEKKLQYIDTYITLQKMRLTSSVRVDYHKSGQPEGLSVAPLTLMPFIENAFKHGISTEKDTFILIGIEIKGNELSLLVRNSRPVSVEVSYNTSQLGIENTIERLKLLYPGRHELIIEDSPDEYTVHLKLHLK